MNELTEGPGASREAALSAGDEEGDGDHEDEPADTCDEREQIGRRGCHELDRGLHLGWTSSRLVKE
jgi:hypothetical protein